MIDLPGTRMLLSGLGLVAMANAWAETRVTVEALSLARADEEALRFTDMTRVDLRIALPGERVLALAGDSRITGLDDDTGRALIGPGVQSAAEAAEAAAAGTGMRVSSSLSGSIRRDAVSFGPDGQYLIVPAVAPRLPAAGASELTLTATLIVEVAGEGDRTVTLTDVDLDDDWGTELEVAGETLRCSLDGATGSGAERESRFYCYGAGVDLVRISARGSAAVAIDDATQRPNLRVTGPVTDLTLDVVLPEAEPLEVPVDVSFGLGL